MVRVRETVKFFRKAVTVVPIRFKNTAAVKLVYSDYGDPSKVIRLEKELLETPGPGKVRETRVFHILCRSI